MWFILSLISIFFWSGSDFFSKLGSPAKDKDSHLKMLMVVGLVMGAHATGQVLFHGVSFTKEILIAYLPVSFLYISSMLLGYIGLRYIELSVSSPICNTSGAVAALLSFIFLKQVLALPQLFAILLILFAIYLLSYLQKKREDAERKKMQEKVEDKYVNSFIAIFFPIFYCIIDGLGTFLDAVVLEKIPEASANVAYEYTFCTLAVCLFFYLVFVKKDQVQPSYGRTEIFSCRLRNNRSVHLYLCHWSKCCCLRTLDFQLLPLLRNLGQNLLKRKA